MTAAHWHLVLNHIPIIGTTICTLLLIAGLLFKNEQIKIITVILIFIMSVFGVIVHQTGEQAEHNIKNDSMVNQSIIEQHEEAAKPAFIVHNVAGILSLLAIFLFKKKRKAFNIMASIIVVISLSAAGLMSYAGYLGGKIRHTTAFTSHTNQTLK